jgi:hypothetical protein
LKILPSPRDQGSKLLRQGRAPCSVSASRRRRDARLRAPQDLSCWRVACICPPHGLQNRYRPWMPRGIALPGGRFGRAPRPRGAARSFDLARGMYLSTELIAQKKRLADAPRHLMRHAGDGAPYLGVRHLGRAPRPRGAARSCVLARGMCLSTSLIAKS